MGPTIRRALAWDADFIAWTILAAQRGHLQRGWFDIALNRPEAETLALVRRITLAWTQSWWHVSRFWIAEADGMPAAALGALPVDRTLAAARSAIGEIARAVGLDAAEQSAIWQRGAYSGKCWVPAGDLNDGAALSLPDDRLTLVDADNLGTRTHYRFDANDPNANLAPRCEVLLDARGSGLLHGRNSAKCFRGNTCHPRGRHQRSSLCADRGTA